MLLSIIFRVMIQRVELMIYYFDAPTVYYFADTLLMPPLSR